MARAVTAAYLPNVLMRNMSRTAGIVSESTILVAVGILDRLPGL